MITSHLQGLTFPFFSVLAQTFVFFELNLTKRSQIVAFLFIMARRSPPRVNQTYETGCTWRMLRIFNFREGHSDRRLVSNRRLNAHANGETFLFFTA